MSPQVEQERILQPRSRAMTTIIESPTHPLHATVSEMWGAAINEANLSWNAVNFLARDRTFSFDPTFDPYTNDQTKRWATLYPEEFDNVFSLADAMDTIGRIEKGREHRRILAESGGTGLMMGIVAGVLDPVNLIPVSWVSKAYQGSRLAAGAFLAVKQGVALSDDAVRLGVRLLPREVEALRTGIPAADLVSTEVSALRGLSVRQAERQVSVAESALEAVKAKTVKDVPSEVAKLRTFSVRTAKEARDVEARHFKLTEQAGRELLDDARKSAREVMGSLDSILAGGIRGTERAGKEIILEAEQGAKQILSSINATLKEARDTAPRMARQAGKELLEEAESAARIEVRLASDALKDQAAYVKGLERELKDRIKSLRGPVRSSEDLAEVRSLLSARSGRDPLFTPRQALGIQETARVTLSKRVLGEAESIVKSWKDDVAARLEKGKAVVSEGIDDAQLTVWEAEDIVASWKDELARGVEEARELSAQGIRDATAKLTEAEGIVAGWRTEMAERLASGEAVVAEGVADARAGLERANRVLANRREMVSAARASWDYRLAKLSKKGRIEEAKKAINEAKGVVEERKIRQAEAALAGQQRIASVQASYDSALGKIAEHKQALVRVRREALEGLPTAGEAALAGGTRAAGIGAAYGAGSEFLLQALQEGRDEDLIVNAAVAGAALGGILVGLGSALHGFSQARLNRTHLAMVEDLTAGEVFARMPEADKFTLSEIRAIGRQKQPEEALANAVVERVGRRSTPAKELLERQGPIRRALTRFGLSPGGRLAFATAESANLYGHAVLPLPYVQREGGVLAATARAQDHVQVAISHARELTKIRGRMDHRDFSREVADIIRTGRTDGRSAEALEGARYLRSYFDSWQEMLKKNGLIPEAVDLGADAGYFPRWFNFDAIRENRTDFIRAIEPYFSDRPKDGKTARDRATEATDELLTHGPYAMSVDSFNMTGVTGQLRARGLLAIPSEKIADFLYDDLDEIIMRYSRNVGSQLEMAKLQPSGSATERINHTEWLDPTNGRIAKEYDELIANSRNEKERARLMLEKTRVLRDAKNVHESVLGFLKRDPFDAGSRVISELATTGASFAFLGNAGFNSMNDVVAPVFTNGASSFWRAAVYRMRRQLKAVVDSGEIEAGELGRQAWLYQFLGAEHSRSGMYFDMLGDTRNAPRAAGGILRRTHGWFMHANLLRPVTAFAAEHNTYTAMDALLRASRQLADGVGISKSQRNNLLLSGLDEKTAARIGRKVLEGGAVEEGGVILPILSKWGDEELATTFRSALIQNTRRGVLNPLRGEVPAMFNNPLGRVFFQFYSWPVQATQSYFIAGLQRRDGAAAMGALMMTGIGMWVVAVNAVARGEEIPELGDLVTEGFTRAGVFGILTDMHAFGSQMTGGAADLNNLFGTETVVQKYGPKGAVDIPAFAAIDRIRRELRTGFRLVNGEQIGEQEAAAFSRRLPLMNAVWAAPIRELIEDAVKSE